MKDGLKKQNNSNNEMTVNELLSAISENEYPDYLIDAIGRVRDWLLDSMRENAPEERESFIAIFEHEFEDDVGSFENLLERLGGIEEFADIIPNLREPEGKPDTLIINIVPPDYENGLRTAIDYSAVFNRGKSQRVWIISNSYTLDEIVKFSPHVDALSEQGITLRYILVTPWGWVEMPLSGATVTKQQFLWHSALEDNDKNISTKKIRRHRRNNS